MVIELVKENVCLVLQCVTFANTVCIRIAHNLSTLSFNLVQLLNNSLVINYAYTS